jgi:hypothetical protein
LVCLGVEARGNRRVCVSLRSHKPTLSICRSEPEPDLHDCAATWFHVGGDHRECDVLRSCGLKTWGRTEYESGSQGSRHVQGCNTRPLWSPFLRSRTIVMRNTCETLIGRSHEAWESFGDLSLHERGGVGARGSSGMSHVYLAFL